jgi:hypothetical protein
MSVSRGAKESALMKMQLKRPLRKGTVQEWIKDPIKRFVYGIVEKSNQLLGKIRCL